MNHVSASTLQLPPHDYLTLCITLLIIQQFGSFSCATQLSVSCCLTLPPLSRELVKETFLSALLPCPDKLLAAAHAVRTLNKGGFKLL